MLALHLISENPKMGNAAGALSLQGYGQLKAVFSGWLNRLKLMEKDIVLIAHMDEQKSGDEMLERLDVQGGTKNEIYKSADMMGRLIVTKSGRVLNFSPTDAAFGKNPAQFEPLKVPDVANDKNFLAGVIDGAKAKLNALSEAQKEAVKALEDWKGHVDGAETPESFTELIVSVVDVLPSQQANAKRMLMDGAKAKGFEYSKELSKFTTKAAA